VVPDMKKRLFSGNFLHIYYNIVTGNHNLNGWGNFSDFNKLFINLTIKDKKIVCQNEKA
jgi:hypothetical protein